MARVYITLSSGTSWTVPADWNNSDNAIHAIGGGGGGDGSGSAGNGDGAGGGAYARLDNYTLTPSSSVSYAIGARGTRGGTTGQGTNGGNTTFNGSALVADGGKNNGGGYDALDGSGGLASSSTGDVTYDGGSGRGALGASNGGGGGGAAGKSGAGGDAGNYNTGSDVGGLPGAGGVLNPNDSAGPGKGGDCAPNATNGDPADIAPSYGGGGGGGSSTVSKGTTHKIGGHGTQGVIVIEYEPFTSFPHTKVEIIT